MKTVILAVCAQLLSSITGLAVDFDKVVTKIRADRFELKVPLETAVFNAERVLRGTVAEPSDALSAVLILAKAKLKVELGCAWWQLRDPVARMASVAALEDNAQLMENEIRYRMGHCDRFREPEATERRQELELLQFKWREIRKAVHDQIRE